MGDGLMASLMRSPMAMFSEGRALYRAVVDADPGGIVAKRLADSYNPKLARWHKVLNRGFSWKKKFAAG
jgi:ATP-dependent DNA ligase